MRPWRSSGSGTGPFGHITVALLGLSVPAAQEAAAAMGLPVRIAKVDRISRILTRDLVAHRLNLVVDNGKVTEVYTG